MRRPATIDIDDLTSDVGRIERQKADGPRNIFRSSGSFEQSMFDDGGTLVR